jgi:hypothetical protein
MLKGVFHFEQYRNGRKIDEWDVRNGIVTVGLNYALDTIFRGTTQISTWYAGLIDNVSYSALDNADTMSSHAGWIELTTYDEAARQTWSPGAASARAITNGTQMTFTASATAAVKGFFVASNSTKGGTTGTLWCTGLFDAVRNVLDGDEIKLTYTVSG